MRRRQREAVGRLLAVLDPQEQARLQRLLARVLAAGRRGGGPSCCTSALHQKEPSADGWGSAKQVGKRLPDTVSLKRVKQCAELMDRCSEEMTGHDQVVSVPAAIQSRDRGD